MARFVGADWRPPTRPSAFSYWIWEKWGEGRPQGGHLEDLGVVAIHHQLGKYCNISRLGTIELKHASFTWALCDMAESAKRVCLIKWARPESHLLIPNSVLLLYQRHLHSKALRVIQWSWRLLYSLLSWQWTLSRNRSIKERRKCDS